MQTKRRHFEWQWPALAAAVLLTASGCQPPPDAEERAVALKVIRRLETRVRSKDYDAAMKLFAPHARQRIKTIGGGDTPIAGFFSGLSPMLKNRSEPRVSRGKLWVTYHYKGKYKLDVAVTRLDGQWQITYMKGDEWGL